MFEISSFASVKISSSIIHAVRVVDLALDLISTELVRADVSALRLWEALNTLRDFRTLRAPLVAAVMARTALIGTHSLFRASHCLHPKARCQTARYSCVIYCTQMVAY